MNDGGPAFPVILNHVDQPGGSEVVLEHEGMSLRDYFATAAICGYASKGKTICYADPTTVSAFAYELADAMLEARKAK